MLVSKSGTVPPFACKDSKNNNQTIRLEKPVTRLRFEPWLSQTRLHSYHDPLIRFRTHNSTTVGQRKYFPRKYISSVFPATGPCEVISPPAKGRVPPPVRANALAAVARTHTRYLPCGNQGEPGLYRNAPGVGVIQVLRATAAYSTSCPYIHVTLTATFSPCGPCPVG